MIGGIAGGLSTALKGLSKGSQPQTGGGYRVLGKGTSGMDVARCQNLLNRELAYSPPPLWVDGIFGPLTDRKCREFQMKKGLVADGIVGPATWSALEGRPIGGGGGVGKGYGGGGGTGKGYSGGSGSDIAKGIGGAIGKTIGSVIGGAGKYLK